MCKAAYIHVPFCHHICAYCDFFRSIYNDSLANRWLEAIQKEIKETIKKDLNTIYIGGGTPSALSAQQLRTLLECLKPYAKHCEEYTMEANIESLDAEKLAIAHALGVNRVSLGVQTLQPSLLDLIHRKHRAQDIEKSIAMIHATGIHNISIDLIYGLPSQTLEMWQQDLKTIVDRFAIQHISLYALTIEPHSEFGRKGVRNIDEDVEADMYDFAIKFLSEHGFEHYEISNFAKPGYASRHNQTYWRYDDFYGIGCGASGKQDHYRYDNTRNIATYLKEGASPSKIVLSKEDEMFEMLMMSLRMKKGMDIDTFNKRFDCDFKEVYKQPLKEAQKQGLLEIEGHVIRATTHGYYILNDVLIPFLPNS